MRLVPLACTTALLALAAGSALASPVTSTATSSLAISTLDFTPLVATIVPAGTPIGGSSEADYRTFNPHGDPYRNDAIRYRERGYRNRRYGAVESPAQIHLGFFDPDGNGATSFLLGLRGGPLVSPNVQIGGGVDWIYRSDDNTVVAGTPYQQGGTTITPTRVLSRASTNLFPFTLFLQVMGDENQRVIPYGGIAGGWEALFLSADDFTTNQSFDATYTGWGWQAWLGAGLPLSGQARVNGEVYVNESEPEREVTDALSGQTFREQVKANGVGMRLGLQFGF